MMRMLISGDSRFGGADRRVVRAWLACCALHAAGATLAADEFERLAAAEIRAKIVGNVVTDESHWSDRFEPNGALKAIELGQERHGTWKLSGDELCMTREAKKPVMECFEIWLHNDEVEYRRDGVTVAAGVLRKR